MLRCYVDAVIRRHDDMMARYHLPLLRLVIIAIPRLCSVDTLPLRYFEARLSCRGASTFASAR